MAVGRSVAVGPWSGRLDDLLGRVAGRFPRIEPRRRIRGFVLGLLADLPRKNCWTIAEHTGETSPNGMQHLLARLAADLGRSRCQGQRYYDWAWVTLAAHAGHHRLLIRRHPRHGELAFYRCDSPTLIPLGELVRVAGRRWPIEEKPARRPTDPLAWSRWGRHHHHHARASHYRRQEAQLT